jgi:hypothetical protein
MTSQPLNSKFYLGRIYDPTSGKALVDKPAYYDPADLVTHAFVTGMTGSGKTGLCIGLLEEAAMQGIPAVIIDPKGDLTNLLLHFPDQSPGDFEPWIDPEVARRAGKTVPALAEETAKNWSQGMASWGYGREQLLTLQNAVDFTVFTPGSSSGYAVNIMASFEAPDIPWEENKEILREKIASTVTALLGLVGITEIDPLRSRPHILLSNIMEHAWSQGQVLNLTELILQTQNPPFDRLGAFPLDNFFPAKDRMDLAVLLNNFLASPSFGSWLEGERLDIQAMLYTAEGKPRHSIFYTAHLSDNERMFFITMLLASVETWMRTQRGTSSLRALLYFDEIVGYLPPIANPPSKPILLRMLKQARAFGLGLLLATQNPVDMDYKALSNAGTWMIGRLQTDQDKQRLLDGLSSVSGSLDRSEYDKMISGLQKRVFLLNNVHRPGGQLFQTRWTLNYLAGPLMRTQIAQLNQLEKPKNQPIPTSQTQPVTARPGTATTPASSGTGFWSGAAAAQTSAKPNGKIYASTPYSSTIPVAPPSMNVFYLPNDLGLKESLQQMNLVPSGPLQPDGIVYRPGLLAQAEVRYLDRRYNIQFNRLLAVMLQQADNGLMRWEDFAWRTYQIKDLQSSPLPQARFATMPGWLSDIKRTSALQKDFIDWVYRSSTINMRANELLKVYASPEVSTAAFREMCSNAARTGLQAELKKVDATYIPKLNAIRQKVNRQNMEVSEQKQEVDSRRVEELGSGGELLLSLFTGRKKSLSSSLSKRRQSAKAKADLDQEKQELDDLVAQYKVLEQQRAAAIRQAQDKWAQTVNGESEVPLAAQRKDIFLALFGVAWMPYYLLPVNGELKEIPAFAPPPK